MAKVKFLFVSLMFATGCAPGGSESLVESVDFDTSNEAGYQALSEQSEVVLEVGLGFDVGDLSVDFFPSDFECGIQAASAAARTLPLEESFAAARSSDFRTIWRVSTRETAGIVECAHGLGADVDLSLQVWRP